MLACTGPPLQDKAVLTPLDACLVPTRLRVLMEVMLWRRDGDPVCGSSKPGLCMAFIGHALLVRLMRLSRVDLGGACS